MRQQRAAVIRFCAKSAFNPPQSAFNPPATQQRGMMRPRPSARAGPWAWTGHTDALDELHRRACGRLRLHQQVIRLPIPVLDNGAMHHLFVWVTGAWANRARHNKWVRTTHTSVQTHWIFNAAYRSIQLHTCAPLRPQWTRRGSSPARPRAADRPLQLSRWPMVNG